MKKRNPLYIFFLVLSAAIFVAALVDRIGYDKRSKAKAMGIARNATLSTKNQIVPHLDSVESEAKQFADELSRSTWTEHALRSAIVEKSESLSFLTGVTVAFVPYAFRPSRKFFAPFYEKDSAEFIDIGDLYDYTDDSLATAMWFTEIVRTGRPKWSEPYYAEGAKRVVTDYGVPFYHTEDKKEIRGVISYTIAVGAISKFIYRTELGSTGYGILISDQGHYIAHPNASFILKHNFREVGDRFDMHKEVAEIMDRESGHIATNKLIEGMSATILYATIPSANWKIISVFRLDDLVRSQAIKKKKRIHLWLATSFLVFVVLIGLFRINGVSDRELWYLAVLLSLIMIPNILNIWYLNLDENFISASKGEIEIQDRSVLHNFMHRENELLQQIAGRQFTWIPTGIHIDEIEFIDSYNVNIGGRIWQKYPDSLSADIRPGYYLPQISPFAESAYNEIVSDEQYPGYRLVTWEFRNTLRMDFDYTKYPFDLPEVGIELIHPEFSKNVVLVPDLDSYEILNARRKPGLSSKMVLPSAKIILSHFSYVTQDYETNFGIDNYEGLDEVKVLQFNILLKRRFINAFVANIIPIFIVALLLYLIVYSSTKKNIEMSGISSLGGVETSAAFFFVLVLAHIDLRKSVNTPDITYIDFFYFIMYLLLGIIAFNIVIFTKSSRETIFDYKDNFWVKLLYWPFLLFLFLLITLSQFYF